LQQADFGLGKLFIALWRMVATGKIPTGIMEAAYIDRGERMLRSFLKASVFASLDHVPFVCARIALSAIRSCAVFFMST
jgi:hypothetical protein